MNALNIGDKVYIRELVPGVYDLKKPNYTIRVLPKASKWNNKICTIRGIDEEISKKLEQPVYSFNEFDFFLTEEFFIPLNSIDYFLFQRG